MSHHSCDDIKEMPYCWLAGPKDMGQYFARLWEEKKVF